MNSPVADTDAGAAAPATTTPAATTADAGGGATATSPDPTKPANETPKFDDLTEEKKVDLMMTKVVPSMGKVFKEHDGKKYAKFGCATCHGPGKKKDDPSKFLPKLSFKNGGYEKLAKAKPAMVKFMSEKVVPAMGEAMGAKDFGCAGCHAVEK